MTDTKLVNPKIEIKKSIFVGHDEPINDLDKTLAEKDYQVLFNFVSRGNETKKLYDAEEKVMKAIEIASIEHLKLADYKPNKVEDWQKTDGYALFEKHYFSKGVTSEIENLLNAYDFNAVAYAIINWLDRNHHVEGKKQLIQLINKVGQPKK